MFYLLKTVQGTVRNWWMSLIIGILSLLFGVIFILQSVDGLCTLTYLFTIGFTITGIFEIVFALSNNDFITGWGWGLAGGILDILLGVMLLFTPGATPTMMVYIVGFWIMYKSICGIGISCDLKRLLVDGWNWLLILSILCLLLSFTFILSPMLTSKFILITAVVAFFLYAVFRIYLSIKFKSLKD
jgi:uncharacterized membrane protein HdeD (DUF308 family)